MKHLPRNIRVWARIAAGLWLVVPVRALAEVIPGLETVADKLTGKSVDYLLMLTTLAAIACTGYVIRMFINFVIQSKADDKKDTDERVSDMKQAHDATRVDFQNAMRAMTDLTAEIRNIRK